jgi:hypothetical protein
LHEKGGETMQTQSQVRFYITQGDDQPVVRSIPVLQRAIEPVVIEQPVAAQVSVSSPAQSQKKKVAGLVRSAVKRGTAPK